MSKLTEGLLVCGTLEEVQQAARACQQWMVDNVARYAGEYWDQPKQRAKDGKFSICVDARVGKALAPEQRERVEQLCPVMALAPEERERVGQPDSAEEWQPVEGAG